jgi:hypothetical protein
LECVPSPRHSKPKVYYVSKAKSPLRWLNYRPWFEPRGFAALLTLRQIMLRCLTMRVEYTDLILRSARRARLEGWRRSGEFASGFRIAASRRPE